MELERIESDLAPAGAAAVDDRTRQVLDYVGDRVADRVHAKSIAGVELTGDQAARLLESFLDRNPNTAAAYTNCLNRFIEFLPAPSLQVGIQKFFAMPQGQMNETLGRFRQHGIRSHSPATVRQTLTVLRSLAKRARLLGLAHAIPEFEPVPLERTRDTRGPAVEAIEDVLANLEQIDTFKAVRDRLLISLLFHCGLRVSEPLGIRYPMDVDLERAEVRIQGKGRLAREIIKLPERTARYLKQYLELAPGRQAGPLIRGRLDELKPMLPKVLYRIVRYEYGLGRPHGLRHTAITQALDKTNGNVRMVAKFARHKNFSTTAVYDDRRTDGGAVSRLLAGESEPPALAIVQQPAAAAPALDAGKARSSLAARDAAIVALRETGLSVPALAAMEYPASVSGVQLPMPAAQALSAWLAARGTWEGPLWTHVSSGERYTARDRVTEKTIQYVLYLKRPAAAVQAPAPDSLPRTAAPAVAPELEPPALALGVPLAAATAAGAPAAPPQDGPGTGTVQAWSLSRIYAEAPPSIPWIWPGYFARGALTLLAGDPKAAGKSTLIFGALGALLRGGSFMGQTIAKTPILYMTEEPAASVREKADAFGLTADLPIRFIFRHEARGGWARAFAIASAHLQEQPAMLIIDTLAAFGVPESNVYAIEQAASTLKNLATRFNAPVVVLHHTRKANGAGLARIRGSSAVAGAVDIALLLSNGADGTRRLEGQGRYREIPPLLSYRLEGPEFLQVREHNEPAPDQAGAAGG